MHDMSVIPNPDPLPLAAPVWLFWSLLMLTFLLHLLAMNLVLGGSILAAYEWLRGRRSEFGYYRKASNWFVKILPVALAAAVTFGVAPLLFVQVLYGRLLYTSSILMGAFWLLVIPLVITAYYGSYLLAFRSRFDPLRTLIALISPLLLLTVAFVYTSNMSLMLRPEVFLDRYLDSPSGWRLGGLDDLTILPRFLHTLLGALAIAGLSVAMFGLFERARNPERGTWLVRHGVIVFTFTTALNFVVGTVFFLSYPRQILLDYLRESPAGSAALAISFLLGLVSFGCGVLTLQARNPGRLLPATFATALLTVGSMLLVRDQVRSTILRDKLIPVEWIEPQWGAIALFGFLLAAAAVAVSWMVIVLYRSGTALPLRQAPPGFET